MLNTNAQVADLLRRYAIVLRLEGVDRFKIKAYQRAAATIESTAQDVRRLASLNDGLESLPGVGKAISAKIRDIVMTGKLPQLDRALAHLRPELLELAAKPRLDPKTVQRVYRKLSINGLAELKQRLNSGEIRSVLGSRVDFHIRHGLEERPGMLRWAVKELASRIEAYLKKLPEALRVEPSGSLRRKLDTIGDLNFLVAGKSSASIFKHFTEFSAVHTTKSIGRREKQFQLSSGINVVIRVTRLEEFGLEQVLSTGSAAHVNELRTWFRNARKSLTAKSLGKRAASEDSVYSAARLAYIEPELREGRGEIEAAEFGDLPQLIELSHLRGDLHMHTIASDGSNSIVEMAEAAKARGYEYIAISDHSQNLKITNGLTVRRLRAQNKAIDKANARLRGITVLKSAEVDILEDGELDYPNSVLKELDLTVCSIHSKFALDKRAQTERLLRAMENPYFNILGHATGRLLLRREGYEIDFDRILKQALECGCFFEINSNPNRLDLSDEHAKLAKEAGMKVAINTDAHSIKELSFITAGVDQARRGWLEPADVLNARSLKELKQLLRR